MSSHQRPGLLLFHSRPHNPKNRASEVSPGLLFVVMKRVPSSITVSGHSWAPRFAHDWSEDLDSVSNELCAGPGGGLTELDAGPSCRLRV